MITNLFPIPVGFYKLDRDLTEEEVKFSKEQEARLSVGNKTSIDTRVLEHESMASIKKFIDASVAEYLKTVYNPINQVSLKVTQSVFNYTEKGGWHHKHVHPNSVVSGVFYPQANKEKDKIYFYKDRYEFIKLPPEEWNIWNSESWWFPVGTCDLVLFPSSLTHMVETVDSEETRISLAFNTFVVGNIGSEDTLTGLRVDSVSGAFK